jgi:hypothetical protein
VWHHHRATAKAFWRQQVGYGEGETWLDAHHPEKFIGGQMLWRGRIYSPLPFVRSFTKQRLNTGVWGTAAFPSVYRTDVNPWQFLPHSTAWMVASTVAVVAGLGALLTPYLVEALLLVVVGGAGWTTTVARCAAYARRTDLTGMPGIDRTWTRLRYRALILWLHLLQPIARAYGRCAASGRRPEWWPRNNDAHAVESAGADAARCRALGVRRRRGVDRAQVLERTLDEPRRGADRAGRRTARLPVPRDWWKWTTAGAPITTFASRSAAGASARTYAASRNTPRADASSAVALRLHPTFMGIVATLGFATLLLGATSAAIALAVAGVSLMSSIPVRGGVREGRMADHACGGRRGPRAGTRDRRGGSRAHRITRDARLACGFTPPRPPSSCRPRFWSW